MHWFQHCMMFLGKFLTCQLVKFLIYKLNHLKRNEEMHLYIEHLHSAGHLSGPQEMWVPSFTFCNPTFFMMSKCQWAENSFLLDQSYAKGKVS